MNPQRWQLTKAVFEQVDGLPRVEVTAALDRLCAGDGELRGDVERLLENCEGTDEFIGEAIRHEAELLQDRPQHELPERIGPYRIVRRIGQGGMGAVFEARRVDDFQKTVAIKVVKQEFDSDYARVRFQQERQLLAMLEHPWIARLLDGGETESGSPYLVLEHVKGLSIGKYCEGRPREEKLRLFVKVCQAVEYAHRNLIIHRDLKPGNVLVTEDGDPKLLDFGIAKLVDTSGAMTQTAAANMAFTPDYASPEQVRGRAISTASDVYSLGVILYQILTERKPYRLDSATPLEMDRAVCIEPPAPPMLGDELDHIILMALRKEPERRYTDVRSFGADIERYLANKPVSARPESRWYVARKFVARNRWGVTAATLIATIAAMGFFFTLREKQRAERSFGEVRQLANKFLFDFDNAVQDLPGSTKAREMVVKTATEYLNRLSQDARGNHELEAELAAGFEKLGDVQGSVSAPSLGRTKDALASYYRARGLWQDVLAARPTDAKALKSFAAVVLKSSDVELRTNHRAEAMKSIELAAASAEKGLALAPDNDELRYLKGGAWYRKGEASRLEDDGDPALAHFAKSLACYRELMRTHPSPRYRNTEGTAESRVGLVLLESSRVAEAVPYLRRTVEARRKLAADNPASVAMRRALASSLNLLGATMWSIESVHTGQSEEAERVFRESVDIQATIAAADPLDRVIREDLLVSRYRLATALLDRDPAEALRCAALAREGLAGRPESTARTDVQENLKRLEFVEAAALFALARYPEALRALDAAEQGGSAPVSEMKRETLRAQILSNTGKRAEGLASLRRLVDPLAKIREWKVKTMIDGALAFEVLASIDSSQRCKRAGTCDLDDLAEPQGLASVVSGTQASRSLHGCKA